MSQELRLAIRRAADEGLGGELVLRGSKTLHLKRVTYLSSLALGGLSHSGAEVTVDPSEIAAFTKAAAPGQWW